MQEAGDQPWFPPWSLLTAGQECPGTSVQLTHVLQCRCVFKCLTSPTDFGCDIPDCDCGAGGCGRGLEWPGRKNTESALPPSLWHHFRCVFTRTPGLKASRFQHRFGFLLLPSTDSTARRRAPGASMPRANCGQAVYSPSDGMQGPLTGSALSATLNLS